jgi:hypothetical protein
VIFPETGSDFRDHAPGRNSLNLIGAYNAPIHIAVEIRNALMHTIETTS